MEKIVTGLSDYFNMNDCITKIFLIFFEALFVIGMFWGLLLIKEKNLVKKLNRKFLHKYITLFILLCTIVSAISTGIIQFINRNILGYALVCTLIFSALSIEWSFIHDRISLLGYSPDSNNLNKFFKYFKEKKISHIKYVEIVTWLSWWIHYYFRLKNEQDDIISKLELLFRPENNGLCLAACHKSDFIELCKKICEKSDDIVISSIIETYEIMCSKEKEKYNPMHNVIRIFFLDKNILWYILIIVFHVAGCILVSETPRFIIGNLFLYLPGDALIFLIYFGIVKQQKERDYKSEQ